MPEASWLKRAREIGVDSFWYKEAQKEPILSVMARTMAGEHVYPEAVPETRVGRASSRDFTRRELEILRALVDGLSNEQIARRMHLSTSTVKTHLRHLLEKTGGENRTHLAVLARASGLVVASATT